VRPSALPTRPYAALLGLLAALFLVRVVGQALVAFFAAPGLPPMGEWYSGLLPYPLLLPVQVVILAQLGWICADFARGEGYWVRPRPGLGRWLQRASYVYAGAMLVRYVVTMAVHPERRWLGTGTIPIVFHWVLAAYVFTLGRFHARG
jgi:hypothetical protein